MPAAAFTARLNEQIAYEFAASQQYIAVAVYYDNETLPRLASFFYSQAIEERNHALMMVRYLMDADEEAIIPAVAGPKVSFADIVEPVQIALEQEKRVTEQIGELAGIARDARDYPSEQFMQWFLKEQVEEVSSMKDLLTVVRRSAENPMLAEEHLAREGGSDEGADPTAPPVAGGAL